MGKSTINYQRVLRNFQTSLDSSNISSKYSFLAEIPFWISSNDQQRSHIESQIDETLGWVSKQVEHLKAVPDVGWAQ